MKRTYEIWDTGSNNIGILIVSGAIVSSTGTGAGAATVTLTGTSGAGSVITRPVLVV